MTENTRKLWPGAGPLAEGGAGKGLANPVGTILSLAMLFRLSVLRDDIAAAIEAAVAQVIDSGRRTPDIADAGSEILTTSGVGEAIAAAI